jgi:hypothetical protein
LQEDSITVKIPITQNTPIFASSVLAVINFNGEIESATKLLPIVTPLTLNVSVFPEGGILGCNLQNRVYFQALNNKNESITIKGNVVNMDGEVLAGIQMGRDGRGKSNVFVPKEKEKLFLEVSEPEEVKGKRFEFPL